MVDKQSVTIIAFIAVFGISAAFLAMGTAPEIFRQGEQLDLALIQQHEDEARANQTLHEDLERDKQRLLIINETNASLKDFEQRMQKYISGSENRSQTGASERKEILQKLNIALDNQEAQLSNQDTQLKLLQGQSEDIQNLTRILVNLTKQDNIGAIEHRTSSQDHHQTLIELGKKIDENIVANMTKKGISPN